ncbi:MAG: class IV adenylate cyclase [bacterium]|nr:class IV adenylate cyclase [bacterium]
MTTDNNLEIEIKLRLDDPHVPAIRVKLVEIGFTLVEENAHEFNAVFDTRDRELKKNHMLLRLRKKNNQTILTFKRPHDGTPDSGIYKIREEIEVEVSDYENAQTIINGLGYQLFFIYEKYREVYRKETGNEHGNIDIMLDRTPIGHFLEIEADASGIDTIAGQLGFRKEDYITSNYYSLFREQHKEGFMQFK